MKKTDGMNMLGVNMPWRPLEEGMTEDDSNTGNHGTLQELFVEMTGETTVTNRQDERSRKRVVDDAGSGGRPDDADSSAAADGLDDAIDDHEPDDLALSLPR